MKKILFVCDGDNFSEGAFRLVKQLHEQEHLFVKGLFFSPVDVEQLVAVGFVPSGEPYQALRRDEKLLVDASKKHFLELCANSGIKNFVDPGDSIWDKEHFIHESRFADLAVISEKFFTSNLLPEQPNYFMHELLRSAECPVLVVPDQFQAFERVAFAYDGHKESMYALKQFAYLLPQLTDLPTDFVYIKEEGNEEIPDMNLVDEYARLHFNSRATSKLHFDPKTYFSTWLEDKKNVLLVAGSYSRSSMSNLLSPSFADRVIRDRVGPVFIAHYV